MRAGAVLAAALLLCGFGRSAFPGDGWVRTDLAAGGRVLASAAPVSLAKTEILTIVIEGDGAAHDARGRPSRDPTPRSPVGLAIARAWPSAAAWLGRPCQYVRRQDRACGPRDWTLDRFSEPAIVAANSAVDQLKARAQARQVRLVGWSGGGVIAAALAARRDDVAGLVTLAAPLDLAAFTTAHSSTPLTGPRALASPQALDVPQVHLFGGRDQVTLPSTGLSTARALAGGKGLVEVWDEAHTCCWARRAPQIAERLELQPR